jgi:hypothetical protein
LGLARAERAAIFASFQPPVNGLCANLGKPAGVWLQERFGEKLNVRRRAPILKEQLVDFRFTCSHKPARFIGERCGAAHLNRIKQPVHRWSRYGQVLLKRP